MSITKKITNFIDNYKISIALLLIFITIAWLSIVYLPDFATPVIQGLFILFTAVATARLAIAKYHSEQRTSRLQKLYFEDAFYGQIKSLETMRSQTIKNHLRMENFFNLIGNLLNQKHISVEKKKGNLENVFKNTLTNIEIGIDTTDFKKETLSKLYYEAGLESKLPVWIKEFELDTYRFSELLQGQVTKLTSLLHQLNESNLTSFEKLSKDISKYIQDNYCFIQRHYILFNLFSELVLELASEKYTTVEKLAEAIKEKKIINKLINETYKDVIEDFNNDKIFIGKISNGDAIKMEERIKCAWGKNIKRAI